MRCPDCGSTIKSSDYNPEYEWFTCPSCDGSFTTDEILKAEQERVKDAPVTAKGKLRRTQLELAKVAEENVKVIVKISPSGSARDGKVHLPSKEVINVLADAVEDVYAEFHSDIDRVNAQDKAIILFREIVYGGNGAPIREKEFHLQLCEEHS